MNLHFQIHYNTMWGEQICIRLTYLRRDGQKRQQLLTMDTDDGALWQLDYVLNEHQQQRQPLWYEYCYELHGQDHKVLRREWNGVARRYRADSERWYMLEDQWREFPLTQHLYSAAHCPKPSAVEAETVHAPHFARTLLFRVAAPGLAKGESLALLGSQPALGDWNVQRYLPMNRLGQHEWCLAVSADGLHEWLEYKFVVVDDATHNLKAWEEGENRSVNVDELEPQQVRVLYGDALRLPEEPWRRAGVAIPLFSVRTDNTWGTGDFGALKELVDWTAESGMRLIQLLPLNDTTRRGRWEDSDPYNPVCVFALHPHYADVEEIGMLEDKALMQQYRRQQHELNSMARMDYEKVHLVKTSYLHRLYEQQGSKDMADAAFKAFVAANEQWLLPYAEQQCGFDCSVPVEYHLWLQWHLHRQLKAAADYARSKGVVLKGDLAIGVSVDGIDVKVFAGVFDTGKRMGTPPDRDNPHGANWRFPAYRWNDNEEECTEWWIRRLKWMEQYFDAVRVDHILGFFRQWLIPEGALSAELGHYAPAQPMAPDELGFYGLQFRKDYMTKPFINDTVISRVFGVHAQYVRDNFLIKRKYGQYVLRGEVSTQAQVMDHFRGDGDENSLWIREGLLQLLCNVLLIEDEEMPGTYHPRVQAYNAPVFHTLSDEEREAFMRMYNNYYYERHEGQWAMNASRILGNVFGSTRMLVCVEDLGVMPECARGIMEKMRFLNLQLPTLPREQNMEFNHFNHFPVRSVCTFSTHDQSPLRLWWQENPMRSQRFYNSVLMHDSRAPQVMTPPLAEEIVARLFYSQSMLCVIAIQDLLALSPTPLSTLTKKRQEDIASERINNPADPYNHWEYRMPLTLSQLATDSALTKKLQALVRHSHRALL